jgi:hypothetical protein
MSVLLRQNRTITIGNESDFFYPMKNFSGRFYQIGCVEFFGR